MNTGFIWLNLKLDNVVEIYRYSTVQYTSFSGMPCVAKYSVDGRWYRAKIMDLPGRKEVDVYYVDFGNEERLWYNQIHKITDDFLKLPTQVVPINCLA